MVDGPIVATLGSPLTDPRLVDAALHAIWPGTPWDDLRTRAKAALRQYPELTLLELSTCLEKFLEDINGSDEASRLLQAHAEQTRLTATAYRPDTKPNWKAVFWPNPSHPEGRPLHGELAYAVKKPVIGRSTAIASAGSCFAVEIKKYLKSNGYNYIETEENPNASANWGLQYNTLAFQQMLEWVFGLRERPSLVWKTSDQGRPQFADAFREGVYYDRLEDYEPTLRAHRLAARAAIERADVFVLTMGLTEVWRLAFSDDVLARYPRQMDPSLVKSEILTVSDNVAALDGALQILLRCNPKLHLIATVSPVPLYATLQADRIHVAEATQYAKSVLNIAIHELVARYPDNVTYFPAFETVLWLTENAWDHDLRHVSKEAVGNVMKLFEAMLLADQ